MKRILMGTLLLGLSMSAHAVSPGGPNCGWGNLLFEGEDGLAPHLLALTTNGTSGNKTFGMTSGTNGCSVQDGLTYGGNSLLTQKGVLEEVAANMATGQGEALTALAVAMGIEEGDRAYFNRVMHVHFDAVFPRPDVTSKQVMRNIVTIMREDERLGAYLI